METFEIKRMVIDSDLYLSFWGGCYGGVFCKITEGVCEAKSSVTIEEQHLESVYKAIGNILKLVKLEKKL